MYLISLTLSSGGPCNNYTDSPNVNRICDREGDPSNLINGFSVRVSFTLRRVWTESINRTKYLVFFENMGKNQHNCDCLVCHIKLLLYI